jgi:signal peptidase II
VRGGVVVSGAPGQGGAAKDRPARAAPVRDPVRWRILGAVLLCGLFADQASKFLAADRLTTGLARSGGLVERVQAYYSVKHLEPFSTAPYVIFRPWWRMRYAENPGAAWSIFRDQPEAVRTTFFFLANLVAAVFVVIYLRRLGPRHRLQQVALSLVLAGAFGNLIDRLARGYVVDFIDWHWWNRPDLYWPTFNVADSMIVVGVALLLLFPGPRPGPVAGE